MFTVALVGPDGAGKTTIARRLEQELPFPAAYLYMGVNLEASALMLPTTRLAVEIKRLLGKRPDLSGPPDPTRRKPPPRGAFRRTLAACKSTVRLANQIAEECFRQAVVRWRLAQGRVVLLDRDYFADYYCHDVAPEDDRRSLGRRLHGLFLRRWYRRPDLVICLDAPAVVMLSRKGEGTAELLERRRQEYFRLREAVARFEVVDATRPLEQVVEDVRDRISALYRSSFTPYRKELAP